MKRALVFLMAMFFMLVAGCTNNDNTNKTERFQYTGKITLLMAHEYRSYTNQSVAALMIRDGIAYMLEFSPDVEFINIGSTSEGAGFLYPAQTETVLHSTAEYRVSGEVCDYVGRSAPIALSSRSVKVRRIEVVRQGEGDCIVHNGYYVTRKTDGTEGVFVMDGVATCRIVSSPEGENQASEFVNNISGVGSFNINKQAEWARGDGK